MSAGKSHDSVPPWRWGVIQRRQCAGLMLDAASPDFEPMRAIYDGLKRLGFRETYWQFVFEGQIGGLIRSPRSQLVEFHVRFFEEGMIYAELELGRSALIHFLANRIYLNRYIGRKLAPYLTAAQTAYFQAAVAKYKVEHPRDWPEWGSSNRFNSAAIRRQMKLFSRLSDWRVLALIALSAIVLTLTRDWIAVPIIAALMVLVYVLAPKRS